MTKSGKGNIKAVKCGGNFWKPWVANTATLVQHSLSGMQKFAMNLLFNETNSTNNDFAILQKELLRLQSKIEELEKRSTCSANASTIPTVKPTSEVSSQSDKKSTALHEAQDVSLQRPPPLPFAANDLKKIALKKSVDTDNTLLPTKVIKNKSVPVKEITVEESKKKNKNIFSTDILKVKLKSRKTNTPQKSAPKKASLHDMLKSAIKKKFSRAPRTPQTPSTPASDWSDTECSVCA